MLSHNNNNLSSLPEDSCPYDVADFLKGQSTFFLSRDDVNGDCHAIIIIMAFVTHTLIITFFSRKLEWAVIMSLITINSTAVTVSFQEWRCNTPLLFIQALIDSLLLFHFSPHDETQDGSEIKSHFCQLLSSHPSSR